jgi:hypothetical protein
MAKSKEPSGLLSEHLRWYLEDADEEQAGEDLEATLVVERLVQTATASLEGFAPSAAEELIKFWQRNPEDWKWAVDDCYSRRCVLELPDIVRRFLKLSPVLVGRIPSSEVSTYLSEATKCFLHSFFQGSIALSRAALEAGINELLLRQLGTIPTVDLIDKLKTLERGRVLDLETSNDAHSVRKAGGTVLHKSPATEQLAFDCLVKARRVLMRLYKT